MNKTSQPKTSPIEQSVMDQIQSGQVHMHRRTYYIALTALSTVVVALLAFASSYFMSIATLWLRIDAASGQAYGAKRNLASMIEAYPWWSLALGLLALGLIVYLVRRVGNLYKVRLLYLIPLIVILFAVIGLALSYSPLPDMFDRQGTNIVQDNQSQSQNQNQGANSNSSPNSSAGGYRRGQ